MTFIQRRGLRALGIVCAASAVLAAVPAGSALAADPYPTPSPTPKGDPKIIEALQKAPELAGVTFDVSGVTLQTGDAVATNEKWISDDHEFLDDDVKNPVWPDAWLVGGKVQPNKVLSSLSLTWAHTNTFTTTRTHDFSFGVTTGFTYTQGMEVGVDGTKVSASIAYKAEFNFTYKYGMQETVSTSDTKTITSPPQNEQVLPGFGLRVRKWVDVGTYEADIVIPATLSGDVILKKCGTSVKVPIGRLAAMKRDEDQGPLFPDTTVDGNILRQYATAHWVANVAARAHTEMTDTYLATGASISSITDDSWGAIPGKASSPSAKTRSLPSVTTQAEADDSLRSIVPCATPSDLNTSGGSPATWTPTGLGTVAVGNHAYLKGDKTLVYVDSVLDRNVTSVAGGWSPGNGKDWTTYVRADGRGYTRVLDGSVGQFERTFAAGTRAVGFHTYLTPTGDLYYGSRRIAQNVTSATGGWASVDWVTYVSGGKGYTWGSHYTTGPVEDSALPSGTAAVGIRTYLAPDGTLSYGDTVVATGVTSATGGIGSGSGISAYWITFVADGRGHSWNAGNRSIRDEVWLPDDAKAVGNHLYLDADGYLYFVDNEVAQNVTSAVGGWGSGADWASYVRVGS
jgi:hypothetical protein